MRKNKIQSRLSIRTSRAFTLVEIMLVVIIIGIIAAIIVPRFAGKQTKAKSVATKSNIATLSLALDSLELDIGRYPTTSEGLDALLQEPPASGAESGWDGPYLKVLSLPNDPWGNGYQYRYPGQLSVDYDIWSVGPDGQDGTEDDIANVELDS